MAGRKSDLFALLLLGAVFAGMLAWTWGRWPDVQIDFGREVYGAWRLAEGDVLQRDVAWLQGPLSVHWNALVLSVLGTSLRSLFLANLVFTGVTVVALYSLLRSITGTFGATVGALTFVLVFACCQLGGVGNDNWIAPYSHELTHGVGLALLCLCAVGRGRIGFAAFLFGLVLLTKPEPALALSLALAFVWVRGERRFTLRVLWAGLPLVLALALLSPDLSVGGALDAIVAPYRHALASGAAKSPYYLGLSGFDAVGERLGALGLQAAGWSVLGLLFLVSRRVKRRSPARGFELGLTFVAALGLAQLLPIPWLSTLAPLPVALGIMVFVAWRTRSLALLGLATFALVLLTKIVLNVTARHYGFALAMPGTALAFAFLTFRREPDAWSPSLRAVGLAVVCVWTGAHLAEAQRWRAIKTVLVGAEGDAFWADDRGVVANQTMATIVRETRGPIAVVPEGALLNYLTRRPSPTRHVNFMPPEIAVWGDAGIAEELEDARVRTAFRWRKDISEYGYSEFGADFAPAIGRWLGGFSTKATLGDARRRYPGRVVQHLQATGRIENVVLVSIDTLRADRLDSTRDLTPTLDALGAEGVRFDRAYSAAPWTLPSHAALFASTWPHATGVGTYQEPGRLDQALVTLAEALRGSGLATAAFTGGGYLSAEFGLAQGFETFDGRLDRSSMRDVVDRATTWLGRRRDQRPFFLFLHTWEVHQYEPVEPFLSRFVRSYDGPLRDVSDMASFLQQHRWLADPGALDESDRRYARDLYDACVASVDHQLGRLFADLRERQLLDSTLIVVTSDHGEEFLEHGGTGHGYTLFEENVRVPLILWHPSLEAARTSEPVSLVDLAPTIASLLGIEPIPGWRGIDLLRGRDGHDVFLGGAHRPFVGAIHDADKVIVSAQVPPPVRAFDLDADPIEARAEQPPSERLLDSLLDHYLIDERAVLNLDVERSRIEELGKLGYVGVGGTAPSVPTIEDYRRLVRKRLERN